MARPLRLIVAGHPHHVLQRGHNLQPVFVDDEDRRAYLSALRDAVREYRLALHAYVLMDNHVHLLMTPADEDGVGRALQALGRRYVSAFNRRHGRRGSLWEGRFKACLIDTEAYFLATQRHVELNPIRAGLASDLLGYRWSSLPHHLGQLSDPLVTDHVAFWSLGNTPFEREAAYRRWLADGPGPTTERVVQRQLVTGGVLGRPEFLAVLGQQVQRSLTPRPRGRPPKAA